MSCSSFTHALTEAAGMAAAPAHGVRAQVSDTPGVEGDAERALPAPRPVEEPGRGALHLVVLVQLIVIASLGHAVADEAAWQGLSFLTAVGSLSEWGAAGALCLLGLGRVSP